MTPDSRIVARARTVLDERRSMSEGVREEQLHKLYAHCPEVEELDTSLRLLGIEIARSALQPDGPARIAEIKKRAKELRQSRARILEKNGEKDPEDISCPRCGDTGLLRDGHFCDCFLRAYREETVARLNEKLPAGIGSFDAFNPSLFSDAWDAEFDSSPRKSVKIAADDCSRFAEEFDKNGENLFLWGPASCGKTYLAGAIARRGAERGFSVDYETAYTLCANFEAQRFGRGNEETEAAVEAYSAVDLLIIDDFGCEVGTSSANPVLYNLINSRYGAGKSTVVVSALSRSEFSGRYLPQIVSRIWEDYHMIVFMSGIAK